MPKWFGIPLALAFFAFAGCAASGTPEETARELIRAAGGEAQMEAVLQTLSRQMPADQGAALRGLINTEELLERIVPVYTRHFTVDEMNKMIDFYGSDAGRKVVAKGPEVFQESAAIGQRYVEEKMAAMQQSMRSSAYGH